MSSIALLAEFEVETEHLDQFLEAARREKSAVEADEPTCLRFDVFLFDDEPGRGVFVEVFQDQEAAATHRETPHFKAFFDDIATLAVKWTARRGVLLTA